MADSTTATYLFTQPEVGASDDTWGTKLNANWAKLDGFLASADFTETGFTGGSATALGSVFRIASVTPTLQWIETDATLPAGRYRAYVASGSFALSANTASAGDFSTSQAIFTASASGISFGVPVSGSPTFLGNLTISSTSPQLYFEETDQTDPAGRYRFYASIGNFYFQRATTADWGSNNTIWSYVSGEVTFSTPVTVGGTGRLNLDGTSPYIWLHDSDGVAATRNYVITGNNGTLRLSKADDAGTIVATMFTGDEDNVYLHPNVSLATASTTGGTVNIGHSTTSQIGFQRAGSNYIKWPNAGNMTFVTDTGVNAAVLTGALFNTYGLTQLAITDGTVNIGSTSSSTIEFRRSSGGINYLKVPDGTSLRVQATGGGNWANVSSASGWAAGTSDVRLKENIKPIHYGLDTVLALRPIQFDWIAEKRHDIGFSAQDVEKLIPEIVELWPADPDNEGEIDTYALRKDALVAVLVKAVQELNARIEKLEGAK
jgi:hypothetical protein